MSYYPFTDQELNEHKDLTLFNQLLKDYWFYHSRRSLVLHNKFFKREHAKEADVILTILEWKMSAIDAKRAEIEIFNIQSS